MKTTIRLATPEDCDDLVRLRFELWPDCPGEQHRLEVAEILRSPGMVALALVEGNFVGFAEVSVRCDHVEGTAHSPVPYVEGWYVASAYRGRGIGRALVSYVEQWAIANGFSELASDAELRNRDSIRVHGRLGFREVVRAVHFVKQLEKFEANKNGADLLQADALTRSFVIFAEDRTSDH